MNRVQQNLQSQLKIQGLTQRQLADAMGVHHQAISRVLRSAGPPSVRTVQRIADGLGVDIVCMFLPIPLNSKKLTDPV